jgi:Fe-S-cluster containining protein
MIKKIQKGLRFECQQSGGCCTSRGEYGFVYLTLKDRKRMAEFLSMTLKAFTQKYCQKTDGYTHLIENPTRPDCRFLSGKACSIYQARPTQCRTWPFWPENFKAKTWSKEIASYCPGIGKGPLHSPEKIQKILEEQAASDQEME